MKDFQIRTKELGRRKHISVEPEGRTMKRAV
jgi:hypothetical protein